MDPNRSSESLSKTRANRHRGTRGKGWCGPRVVPTFGGAGWHGSQRGANEFMRRVALTFRSRDYRHVLRPAMKAFVHRHEWVRRNKTPRISFFQRAVSTAWLMLHISFFAQPAYAPLPSLSPSYVVFDRRYGGDPEEPFTHGFSTSTDEASHKFH